MNWRRAATGAAVLVLAACGGGGGSAQTASGPAPSPATQPAGAPPNSGPTTDPRLSVATGFVANTIAAVPGARELAALPNGDLLAGTTGSQLWLVPNAENAGAAGTAHAFIDLHQGTVNGVAISPDGQTIYAATQTTIFRVSYHAGDQTEPDASAQAIAHVRTGSIAPHSDGDVHTTTSVGVTTTTVYVGIGSSCNACTEVDASRAAIWAMNPDGTAFHQIATRIRNPIALAIDPASNALWAGGAGQDALAKGHPYEYMDDVTAHGSSIADYGWPECEEDHHAYTAGTNCATTVAPLVEFPAYATHIGAAFYPANEAGTYAFPAAYRGGLFVTSHGSWHSGPSTPPNVAFVAMTGDAPRTAVNWNDPTAQWQPFMTGFGTTSSTQYIGRPTGVAVGAQGSLFVADGDNGVIYRIRP